VSLTYFLSSWKRLFCHIYALYVGFCIYETLQTYGMFLFAILIFSICPAAPQWLFLQPRIILNSKKPSKANLAVLLVQYLITKLAFVVWLNADHMLGFWSSCKGLQRQSPMSMSKSNSLSKLLKSKSDLLVNVWTLTHFGIESKITYFMQKQRHTYRLVTIH